MLVIAVRLTQACKAASLVAARQGAGREEANTALAVAPVSTTSLLFEGTVSAASERETAAAAGVVWRSLRPRPGTIGGQRPASQEQPQRLAAKVSPGLEASLPDQLLPVHGTAMARPGDV